MDDFNRISYVVKNSPYLKGLLFLPLGLVYSFQMLITDRVFTFYGDGFPFNLIFVYGGLFLLIGIFYYFYAKSIGSVSLYPKTLSGKSVGKAVLILFLYIVTASVGIFIDNFSFFSSLFLAFLTLVFPNFKNNLKYRKYVFMIAAAIVVAGILPLNRFFTFGTHFEQPITRAYLPLVTFGILTAVCNHFALLNFMRPLRPETIRNTPASLDPVLGDPANLTVLAALANCQNADFVFLQKISQLDEYNFTRQIYSMEQAGLLYTFQLPTGIFKNRLAASITPTGWQIVTQIYNETIAGQTLSQPQPSVA